MFLSVEIIVSFLFLLLLLLFLLLKKRRAFAILQREHDFIFDYIIIMHFDLDGKIVAVSDAYEKVFGFSKSSLIGETIDKDYISPSYPEASIWNILKKDGHFEGEMQLLTKEGNSYWLYKQIMKDHTLSGEHKGYISVSKDITAIKKLEAHQELIIDQSRHAIMGEMISMIAHQWRQPLATMSSVTTAIRFDIELNQIEPRKLLDQIENIDTVIEHLDETIEDFRTFFKSNKSPESFILYDLVHEALKLIDFKLSDIPIDIHIDKEAQIYCLKNELLQVIINLLTNAADAVQAIEEPKIDITLNIEDSHHCAVLIIGDNGSGIDEKILPHIFDLYFSTKSKNGTGLGLYISKTIIETHLHGILNVRNRKAGCEFIATLPYEESTCE